MITTRLGNNIIAHHDGGYEGGPVILVIPAEQADLQVYNKGPATERDMVAVTVPFDVLKELVADYLRGKAIEFYEQADDDVILHIHGGVVRGT